MSGLVACSGTLAHRLQAVHAHAAQRRGLCARRRVHLELVTIVFSTCFAFQAEADSPSACPPVTSSETGGSGCFVAWFRSDPRKHAEGPDIRNPGPDLANFPNSSFTLPRLGFYLETSPFNMASPTELTPLNYNWEVFARFGITDNIEARVFTGGLAVSDGTQPMPTMPIFIGRRPPSYS